MAATETDKLTFGELKVGDKFIAFPLPGDDSGHGGFKGTHHIFMKICEVDDLRFNAVRLSDGWCAHATEKMYVIKVA